MVVFGDFSLSNVYYWSMTSGHLIIIFIHFLNQRKLICGIFFLYFFSVFEGFFIDQNSNVCKQKCVSTIKTIIDWKGSAAFLELVFQDKNGDNQTFLKNKNRTK